MLPIDLSRRELQNAIGEIKICDLWTFFMKNVWIHVFSGRANFGGYFFGRANFGGLKKCCFFNKNLLFSLKSSIFDDCKP